MSKFWEVTPSDAFVGAFDAYVVQTHNALVALANSYAPRIETWMKANAKWTDRTANARQGLKAEVFDFSNMIVILLRYSVDYGDYLELAMQGRFAIIAPALDHFWPQLLEDIKRIVQ